MSSPDNPYESPRPEVGLPPVAEAEYMHVARRPKTPLVLGIISLVFGAFGLLGDVSAFVMYLLMPQMAAFQQALVEKSGQSMNYVISMWIIGTLLGVWLLATGIGLVRYRSWGRMGFNVYAVVRILVALVGVYMAATQSYPSPEGQINSMENELEMVQRATAVITSLLGMLFPVLGMYFLNRAHILRSLK